MANKQDAQLAAMQGEDMLSDNALLKRLLEEGGETITDLMMKHGPPVIDLIMRALTGGTEKENLAKGFAHPAYSKLGQLRTARVGAQEGHAVASEELMRRFGPEGVILGGLGAEVGEYLAGTSGAEGEMIKDTLLDLGANAAGATRVVSPAASDWMIDQMVDRWGNPIRVGLEKKRLAEQNLNDPSMAQSQLNAMQRRQP